VDVILASQSPRRRELLARLFPSFRVVPSGIDETGIAEADPVRFAMAAAEAKARDVAEKYPDALVIGADTIVCLGLEIFGKPAGRAAAEIMLERLSGRKHRVITGVALIHQAEDRAVISYEITYVAFKTLDPAAIAAYLDRHEYLDKAGSYAIQEIGDAFIEKIEGDYDNIVGFPVKRVKHMLKELDAPEWEMTVRGVDFAQGWAYGEAEGQRILVPGGVVGDKVKARLVWRKPRAARILSVVSPSPDRVEAPCPHFGACGGCAFQNLSYPQQLALKQEHFEASIRAAGGNPLGDGILEPILPSPDLYGYRNKMEFAFGGEAGAVKLGLRARALPGRRTFKRTVPLRKCLIFGDAAERLFAPTLAFANMTGFPPYDPLSQRGFFRNLLLRQGKTTGDLMAVLVTKSGGGFDAGEWAERLRAAEPRLRSVWTVENDRVADLVDFESARPVAGDPFIEDELGGLRFRIYPESFFQPNPRAALLFYGRIADRARAIDARRALGLFCGPGPIELFVSRVVDEVVGIDSEARNIQNAEENAALNGIHNARFVQGAVEKVVDENAHKDFDLLILDPPREGVRAAGMTRVLTLRVPHIAYMSCNPPTLARDLVTLAAAGYRLEKLVCADFFPHTPHMETLAFLSL
jgi:23S rRNA (uracil-5-)-methyltransferase RumA/MAF protein